jgi:hypothetical protein
MAHAHTQHVTLGLVLQQPQQPLYSDGAAPHARRRPAAAAWSFFVAVLLNCIVSFGKP